MSSGSSPSEGFRESLKRRARRVKKWLRLEVQMFTRAPSPQPQASSGTPPSQVTSTHKPPPPPAQIQQAAPLPQSVPSASGSMSTANLQAANTVQSADAESTPAQAAKRVGADAWMALKATLKLLEKSLDVFPSLKSAVAEFLDIVDIFEASDTAAQNKKDYAELASNLKVMIDEFREHPGEHTSSNMSEALKVMRSGLEKEMQRALEQHQRSGLRGFIEAGKAVGDVQECHHRVDILCRELQNTALLRTWSIVEEQQSDARLKDLNAALKAVYNSGWSRVIGRRKCTPGTRKSILVGMREWADDPNGPKVYWLNGMAGTGKTTLAYSFCAEMQHAGRLGGSFFCSRGDPESKDASRIVPTIAHQLARLLPSYQEALFRQMSKDKDIGERDTETQFEELIRVPLCETEPSKLKGIIVTIDALDECDRRDGAQDILNALLNARDLPIKFFVTCRPEPGLFNLLQSKDESYRAVLHVHDIESSFVQADIKTYLETELGPICLPREKLELLAEQAGTLFIYAATAVRYIRPKTVEVNSNRRLEHLLSVTSKTKTNKHKDIDDLYRVVLTAPFNDEDLDPDEKEIIRLVLDTAICAREPMSIMTMAKLLELDEEQDVRIALQRLLSVLHVSPGADLVSTLHASFPDFMLNRERSGDLGCNAAEHHRRLSLRCFSTMHRLLRFNICELESSFVPDEKAPNLAKKIEKAITPELFYACRYWAAHLVFLEDHEGVHSELEGFLSNRLLFWTEVLNLNQCIHISARSLFQVQAWTQRTRCSIDLQQLTRDAWGFVTMLSSDTISHSTPHIYISALPFWPEQRPVSKHYWPKMKGLPKASGTGMGRREAAPLAICVNPSPIYCVAYSFDGARIVSGSEDNTIRVWDSHTGQMIGKPLKGHTDEVKSVAYSSDGARIVSGSYDNTIRVWDAHTGKMIGKPLEGHTGAVWSVAYSSDGACIVSGSHDKTIRVWDAHTGKMIGKPLEGHIGTVKSVAYSSDGARTVSGSDDNTIRVWDAHTGKMIGKPLEGHTGTVKSVAYSPDGTHIVSGSYDTTIRIANFGYLSNDPCSTWILDEDGYMLASGSELLMWVPPDVRDTLIRPQNTAIISTRGSVKVDLTNTHIGESWVQCYRST